MVSDMNVDLNIGSLRQVFSDIPARHLDEEHFSVALTVSNLRQKTNNTLISLLKGAGVQVDFGL